MIHRLTGAVLLVCLLVGLVVPAAAQEDAPDPPPSPITMQVEAGYSGAFRIGTWYPVNVIISNDGPDVRGVLEVAHTGSDAAAFQQAIDLPRGARKQVQLYGIANGFNRTISINLLVADQLLVRERVQLEPFSTDTFVIGVVGTDRTLLNSLQAMPIDDRLITATSVTVVHIPPQRLPDRFSALEGLDMLVLHEVPADVWTEQQIEQLDLWVHMGGQLVVGGGLAGEPTLPPLDAMLPVAVGTLQTRPVQPLVDLVPDASSPNVQSLSAFQVALRDGATTLDSDALISVWQRGGGRVTLLAFDPAALRGWIDEPLLWSQIATVLPRMLPGSSMRWNDNNLLDISLQLPELQLPPVFMLLLYIAVYVLAVGPMNFLILRRMRRADLAWITIPLTVLVFVLGTYGASLLLRGVRPQLVQINLVQGFEGFDIAHYTANVGIFSPRRERYTLRMPPQTLASSERFNLSFDEATRPLLWTDADSRFEDALVDVSSLRTFIIEQDGTLEALIVSDLERSSTTQPLDDSQAFVPTPVPFATPTPQAALRTNPPLAVSSTIRGSIENISNIALEEALLVYGSSVEPLGTLAPGARVDVEIAADQFNFPPQGDFTAASEDGLFNRRQIIDMVFGGSGISMNPPVATTSNWQMRDPNAVYLLGWSDQPVLPLELSDVNVEQNVSTLYIVQLALAP